MTQQERPTVVVSRRVKPGFETAFQTWVQGFTNAVAATPGYVSHQAIPPVGQAQPDWVFVFTFEDPASLRAWVEHPTRTKWLEESEPMLEGPYQAQLISGLEALFGLKSPAEAKPPAVWKLALATMAGLWPTAMVNAWLLGPLLGHMGIPLRTFIISAVTVAQMTWIVMPLVTRSLKHWIQPRK